MQSHHYRREQRRAKQIALAVLVVVVVAGGVLILLPDFRLELGQRLGLVPGADAEQLFEEGEPVELIVLVTEVPVQLTLPEMRYEAVYIAERTGGQTILHDINQAKDVVVPLASYDRISASFDRSAILIVDESSEPEPKAFLVTITTGQVEELPPGETDPGIPGNWDEDIGGTTFQCDGVSPNGSWVACISHGRAISRYIFGSWELRVSPYGNASDKTALYRGGGSDPIAGWSADERWIYFQNEKGTFRVAAPLSSS